MITVCPRCDKALFVLEYKGIAVDFCHHCRGVWLDRGELELLLERSGADAHAELLRFQHEPGRPSPGRRMLCPRCDRRLREIPVRGRSDKVVMLDRCPRSHGIWFDDGELPQLLELFPPESHAARALETLNELLGKSNPTKGTLP